MPRNNSKVRRDKRRTEAAQRTERRKTTIRVIEESNESRLCDQCGLMRQECELVSSSEISGAVHLFSPMAPEAQYTLLATEASAATRESRLSSWAEYDANLDAYIREG